MIARAEAIHDTLPMRGRGLCEDCDHRYHRDGDPVRVRRCEVHGHQVHTRDCACTSFSVALSAKIRKARYLRNLAQDDGSPLPVLSRPVAVLITLCPRCGSGMVYRDDDGSHCICGWADWATARESGIGQRPMAEAMARMVGSRRWGV